MEEIEELKLKFSFIPEEYAVLFSRFITGELDADTWGDYTIAFGQFWINVLVERERERRKGT